jgi:hypothetical protein
VVFPHVGQRSSIAPSFKGGMGMERVLRDGYPVRPVDTLSTG